MLYVIYWLFKLFCQGYTIKFGKEYEDSGQDYYEQKYKDRVIKNLAKKARLLGLELTPIQQLTEEVP